MKIYKLLILFASFSFFSFDFFSCEKCKHEYEIIETVNPTCENDGYKLKKCKLCNEFIKEKTTDKLGHQFSNWEEITPTTSISDGKEIRKCNNCEYVETKIIPSTSYIDLDIIRENLDFENVLQCDSIDYLQLIFDTAILNNIIKFDVNINIPNFDFNNTLSILVANCSVESTYKVNASYSKYLTISLQYKETATTPASNTEAYVQYNSANYDHYQSSRDENFEDFRIKNSIYSYNVSTSDQLFYVLERGVLPLPEKGSSAENIYELAKDVLRNIIDDNMSELDKIRAIHDYLILNVTYDAELLNKTYQGDQALAKYNGFYLEGVFIDKRAVCEGISKAFSVLCNIEGIPCVQVIGSYANNSNSIGHTWNKVYLEGKWYVVDVTSDGTIINNNFEVLSYQYFLITDELMNKKFISETRNNIICDTMLNAYEKIFYTVDAVNYDLYIESFEELVNALNYYENLNLNKCSFEMKIAFNYGSSIIDEIQNAYNLLKMNESFSHILTDNILTIIK